MIIEDIDDIGYEGPQFLFQIIYEWFWHYLEELFTGDREIKNSWKIQDLVRSLYSFTTPSIKSIWCFSWIVLDMTDFSWVLQVKQIKIFLKLSTLLKRTSLLKFISRSSILDQVCCWWLHLLLRFYHYPSNYVLAWCCSVYLFFFSHVFLFFSFGFIKCTMSGNWEKLYISWKKNSIYFFLYRERLLCYEKQHFLLWKLVSLLFHFDI